MDRVLSRPIVLGWSLWLLASWGVNWLIDGPAHASAVAVTPVVRWTMVMSLVGLSTYWPMLRLSAAGARANDDDVESKVSSGALVLVDLWGLLLVFQVILWPARFLAGWTVEQALMIDAAVAMHAMIVGVWIALGMRSGSATRIVMMGLALVTLILPEWLITGRVSEAVLAWAPMRAVWVLTDHLPLIEARDVLARQAAVMLGALIVLGALATCARRRDPGTCEPPID